jgi:drug/metabolite transporter (DMT)-like permease
MVTSNRYTDAGELDCVLVVTYSLLTAFCNALSSVLAAMGMRDSNANAANLYTAVSQAALLSVLLVVDMPPVSWTAVIYFAASGALANCVARLLNFRSMRVIGVANTSAIVGSSPLISTVLAIAFLGEPMLLTVVAGAALVFLGVCLISGSEGLGQISGGALVAPALSATFYAASNVFRKLGLNVQTHSVLAAQSSTLSGLLLFTGYLLASGQTGDLSTPRRSLLLYGAAGLVGGVSWIAIMRAMNLGTVSVVGTIAFSYPLISLVLTWLLLRDQERITARTVLGCVIVVYGVILVTLLQ